MEHTEHERLFERIDEIETLDDFINWVRDLSAFAETDEDIQNPMTPHYLECLSAFMEASKHMTPLEASAGSISLKSMAQALMSALTYE